MALSPPVTPKFGGHDPRNRRRSLCTTGNQVQLRHRRPVRVDRMRRETGEACQRVGRTRQQRNGNRRVRHLRQRRLQRRQASSAVLHCGQLSDVPRILQRQEGRDGQRLAATTGTVSESTALGAYLPGEVHGSTRGPAQLDRQETTTEGLLASTVSPRSLSSDDVSPRSRTDVRQNTSFADYA